MALALLCILLFSQSAHAIVTSSLQGDPIVFPGIPAHGIDMGGVALIGHDVPNSTQLDDILFVCTGALISDRHVLSAAHCYDEDEDGRVDFFVDAFPFAAAFQLADRTEILRIDTAQIHFAPGWPDPDADLAGKEDLAVLTLEEPAPPDIPRYPLYGKRDEVGQTIVVAGYGATGYGGFGLPDVERPLSVNTLRAGLNRYDAAGEDLDGPFLRYDFDSGFPENNAMDFLGFDSDLGLGADEVHSASGDSGGPVFLGGAIAGVTSFTSRVAEADLNDRFDGSWGEVSYDVRVSSFIEFIRDATGGTAVFVLDGLPGDYNASGLVEQADLDLVLTNWGTAGANAPAAWTNDPPTGFINQNELDAVLLHWGEQAPIAATTAPLPEPATAVLTIVGLAAVLAYTPFVHLFKIFPGD